MSLQYLHTMVRVKDLEVSIAFYELLGLKQTRRIEREGERYTLVFMSPEGHEDRPIELTYNWDTSEYEHGNAFGHIAIEVDDIYKTCEAIKNKGAKIIRDPGPMMGSKLLLAFIEDPNGYKIELIEKGTF